MHDPVALSANAQNYIRYKESQRKEALLNGDKFRFDLAEGVFVENRRYAYLPDRQMLSLKQKISDFLNVAKENISLFAGADEIIEVIPRLYLNAGEIALTIVPTFERMIATNYKVGGTSVPFHLNMENHFEVNDGDIIQITNQAKRLGAKIIWLCTPNNPTGKSISLDRISAIARMNPTCLIVVNEVYQEYLSLDPNKSAATLVNDFRNILVIRSFSKAFCLAGARIGYAIANSHVINMLNSFKTLFGVSTPAQLLAIAALDRRSIKKAESRIEKIRIERRELERFINRLDQIQCIEGSDTNFFFLRHKTKDLFSELSKKGFVVSDWRTACGIENMGFVRVSINRPRLNRKLKTALAFINANTVRSEH